MKLWRTIPEAEMATLGRELFAMASRVAEANRTQKDAHVQAFQQHTAKQAKVQEQRLRALHMANAARHYNSVKYQQQAGHLPNGRVIRPIPMGK